MNLSCLAPFHLIQDHPIQVNHPIHYLSEWKKNLKLYFLPKTVICIRITEKQWCTINLSINRHYNNYSANLHNYFSQTAFSSQLTTTFSTVHSPTRHTLRLEDCLLFSSPSYRLYEHRFFWNWMCTTGLKNKWIM